MADELEPQPGGARPGLCLCEALALKQRPDLAKEVDQKLAAARNLKCGSAGIPDARRASSSPSRVNCAPSPLPAFRRLSSNVLNNQSVQAPIMMPPINTMADVDRGEIGEQSGQRRRRLPAIENRRTI